MGGLETMEIGADLRAAPSVEGGEKMFSDIAWKNAIQRGIRTFVQTFAALLVALPVAETVSDIRLVGAPIVMALYAAGMAGVIAFLQNLFEDNTGISVLPREE